MRSSLHPVHLEILHFIFRFIFSTGAGTGLKGLFSFLTSVLAVFTPASLAVLHNQINIEDLKTSFSTFELKSILEGLKTLFSLPEGVEVGVYILLPLFFVLIFRILPCNHCTRTHGMSVNHRLANITNDRLIVASILMLFFFLLQVRLKRQDKYSEYNHNLIERFLSEKIKKWVESR